MKRVAILYIGTGKYTVLWKEFYESVEKYFLCDCEKHYFVLTDAQSIPFQDENNKIHLFFIPPQPWPYPTLLRFQYFLEIEKELDGFSYVFFLNGNFEALKPITQDRVLPRVEKGEDLVVVEHLCNRGVDNYSLMYERNPRSKAYVPFGCGSVYVVGGFIGGTKKAFFRMCRKCDKWTKQDLKRNVIPSWHDESFLNKYILTYPRYRLLPMNFAHPGCWNCAIPDEAFVLWRDKGKYFDVVQFKKTNPRNVIGRASNIINDKIYKYSHIRLFNWLMNIRTVKKDVS